MSISCPSCGSVVDPDAITCPVCGENIAAPGITQAYENEPAAGAPAISTATASPATPSPASISTAPMQSGKGNICPSCGAANAPDARFCSTCGTGLSEEAPEKIAKSTSPKAPRSAARDYLFASIGAVVIAGIVFLVSMPEEHTSAPQADSTMAPGAAGANGAMPPGHPPANQPPELTAEQKAKIDALEKKVAADPSDVDAKLELANIYYDLERHTEAVPLYRDYLAKNPGNADVRTDLAYSIASNGDLATAIGELNQVLKTNPKHQNAAYNLATMYLAQRNRDSTLYWLQRVMDIDSTTRPGQAAAQILQEVRQKATGQAGSGGDSATMGR